MHDGEPKTTVTRHMDKPPRGKRCRLSGFGDPGDPVIELRTFGVLGLMTMLVISAGRDKSLVSWLSSLRVCSRPQQTRLPCSARDTSFKAAGYDVTKRRLRDTPPKPDIGSLVQVLNFLVHQLLINRAGFAA